MWIYQITNTSRDSIMLLKMKRKHKITCWCNRCFLNCLMKVKVAEGLTELGTEYHTFGPTNLREHFTEDELL